MKIYSWLVALSLLLLIANFTFDNTQVQDFLITHHSNSDNAIEENRAILNFLQTGELTVTLTVEEYEHMQDVRNVKKTFAMISIAIIVCTLLLYWFKRPEINFTPVVNATAIIIALIAVLPGKIFELFHEVVFHQGNYTFATDSFLITLYPGEYFFALTAWILGVTLLLLISVECARKHYWRRNFLVRLFIKE